MQALSGSETPDSGTRDNPERSTLKEITASGIEALELSTALLQRARLADPTGGLFEAADVQWWWARSPRSAEVEELYWLDDAGPVAGVSLTRWSDDDWQCVPMVVPSAADVSRSEVWDQALEHAARQVSTGILVPVRDDDDEFRKLATLQGFAPDYQDCTAWMNAADRPAIPALPDGFVLVDRTQRPDHSQSFRLRNGDDIAHRLRRCSLYDPELDLAVETVDGQTAAYSLYWFDPVTTVGVVEPVRVEDEFHRRGLARTMLATGIDRLAGRGARRISVSYASDAAAALYLSSGFRQTSSATWLRAPLASRR